MAGSKKGRRTRTTLSADREREIVKEYYERWRGRWGAVKYLAEKFKVSRQTIHNVLKRCEHDHKTGEVIRLDLSSLPFDA